MGRGGTSETQDKERESRLGARPGYHAANEPPLVRAIEVFSLSVHFLVSIPMVLLRGTFRGQRVHPVGYFIAAAVLVAVGLVFSQHASIHGRTYCEVYGAGLPPALAAAVCGGTGHVLYDDGMGLRVVRSADGARTLYFGGTAQTRLGADGAPLGGHVNATVEAAVQALRRKERPRVALLGLGGGAMAAQLLQRCAACRVAACDALPAVVALCREHFLPEAPPRLTYSAAEARAFLLGLAVRSQDLIINDASMALRRRGAAFAVAATHQEQAHLVPLAHGRLRPGGAYIINMVCPAIGPHSSPLHDVVRRLERKFDRVRTIRLDGAASVLPQQHVIVAQLCDGPEAACDAA